MCLSALLLIATAPFVTARLFPRPGWDNPWEIEYNLYYGKGKDIDISKMFILPPIEKIKPRQEEEVLSEMHVVRRAGRDGIGIVTNQHPAMLDLEQTYQNIKEKSMFHDFDDNLEMEKDFLDDFPNQNNIREKIQNVSHIIKDYRRRITRRYYNLATYAACWGGCYKGWYDWQDDRMWQTWTRENRKRVMVIDLILAFLIHLRFKLRDAMVIRYLVRNDKRYMLAYNFNRLRRLTYDMRKLFTSQIFLEENHWQRDYMTQIFVHRHFMHLERDVKDTIHNIQHIYYNQIEPVTYKPKTKPPRSKKTKKTTTVITTTPRYANYV